MSIGHSSAPKPTHLAVVDHRQPCCARHSTCSGRARDSVRSRTEAGVRCESSDETWSSCSLVMWDPPFGCTSSGKCRANHGHLPWTARNRWICSAFGAACIGDGKRARAIASPMSDAASAVSS